MCPPLLNQIYLKAGNDDHEKGKKTEDNRKSILKSKLLQSQHRHELEDPRMCRWHGRTLQDGIHVVVGTPGHVHGMIQRRALRLDTILMFVLDEGKYL